MKENKTLKLIAFTLLITIIAIILVAGTYAKYASSASGSDSAVVAKWDIKAGPEGNEVSITGDNATVAFNLFDTILDEDGTAETDVTAGKIAPGTSGAFELSVKNDSQVNAEYGISFNLGETTIPLEFRVNGGEWAGSLSSVATTNLDMNTSSVAKVEWRWAYETADADGSVVAGDGVDTELGITMPEVTVTATLNVSQVD